MSVLTRGEKIVCYSLMLLAFLGANLALAWADEGRVLASNLLGWPSVLLLLFTGEWQR